MNRNVYSKRQSSTREMNKTQRVLKNTDNVDKSLERMTKEKKKRKDRIIWVLDIY